MKKTAGTSKYLRRVRCSIVGLLASLPMWGWAAGEVDTSILVDPLRAIPETLAHGERLPGEDSPLICPQQTPAPGAVLSLLDAIHLALCANPRVQLAWIAIETQAANLGQARSAWLPKVNATARRLRDTTDAGSVNGLSSTSTTYRGESTSVSMVWRLLDFGTRNNNMQAADNLLAAALATHDATLQQTMAAVVQAWFDAQIAQASWLERKASLEAARNTLEVARRKEANGAGSTSETLQAKTAVARAALDVSRAQGNFAQSRMSLANVVGLPADAQFQLPELVAPEHAQLGRELANWLAEAQAQHPAITAAKLQEAAALAQVKAVRADGLPSLDFMVADYRNGRPDQGLSGVTTSERQVGFVLSIPLFEGFERNYRIRGAEALTRQRQAELHDAEQRVALEVAQAYAQTTSALESLQISKDLLDSATASQASSSRRYQNGVADMTEVLNTQQALADAWQQRSLGIAQWYAASLRMAAAVGHLGYIELRDQGGQQVGDGSGEH